MTTLEEKVHELHETLTVMLQQAALFREKEPTADMSGLVEGLDEIRAALEEMRDRPEEVTT